MSQVLEEPKKKKKLTKSELEYIVKSVNTTFDELKEFEQQVIVHEDQIADIYNTKQEYIITIVKKYDELREGGHPDYQIAKDKIGARVLSDMRERKLIRLSGWAVSCIPDEFKDQKFVELGKKSAKARRELEELQLSEISASLLSSNESYISESVKQHKDSLANLDEHQIQDLYDDIYSTKKEIKERESKLVTDIKRYDDLESAIIEAAKDRKIALLNVDSTGMVINHEKKPQKTKPTVSVQKPQSRRTEFYDAVKEFDEEVVHPILEKIAEFPPEFDDESLKYAAGFRVLKHLFNAGLDLKMSKSILGWFKTERIRSHYGKNAAKKLTYTVANLCANCCILNNKPRDPQVIVFCEPDPDSPTRWRCPECDGTKCITRNLTREQIGDKTYVIVDIAEDIIRHIPGIIEFCEWYSNWVEPRIAARKTIKAKKFSFEA